MQVGPLNALLQAMLAAPQAKRPDGAAFKPELAAPQPPATPPATPNPVQSVQMLVALAAAGPEPERRRQMAREAEEGLSELQKLHAELVTGAVRKERLEALRQWTRRRGRPAEAELATLMDEIELRILVELAKQERR